MLSSVSKVRFVTQRFGRCMSSYQDFDLFTPTEQHAQLRSMVRSFCESEVIPQAIEWNRREEFNVDLFRKLGELGLLGITVDEKYGGSGMDATAALIVHEEVYSRTIYTLLY